MLAVDALAEAGLTEADIQLRMAYLIGFWLEGLLYGVYLCLFIFAFPVLIRKHALKNTAAAVFVTGNVLMFVLISIFTSQSPVHFGLPGSLECFQNSTPQAISVFLPIIAFAYQADIEGTSRMFEDLRHWANYAPLILGAIIFMTGDILVIYRCFIIWKRRYCVILVPSILTALAAGLHGATLGAIGLVSVHAPSLLAIMRIIIESAAIYTAGVSVMVVVIALDHPARFTMHSCMMPIIGIALVLMGLRTHAVQEESKEMPATASLIPTWLVDERNATDPGPGSAEDESR
ncbi:hypothetical protein BKA70DRAFT_1400384 [Coprinopsis sp. MPI-PUGE-AT-0042]|nr:hypothetical protein BKA70DRAFT_1400384 [Coprinopsis sp. MPI-PUGE-AT-0042]